MWLELSFILAILTLASANTTVASTSQIFEHFNPFSLSYNAKKNLVVTVGFMQDKNNFVVAPVLIGGRKHLKHNLHHYTYTKGNTLGKIYF